MIQAIQGAIYATCERDHPQTVRGVFYQLEVAGLVPKDLAGYSVVQRECLKMRRRDLLPYAWITDGTRLQRKPTSYDDLGDFYFRPRNATAAISGRGADQRGDLVRRKTRWPACCSRKPRSGTCR